MKTLTFESRYRAEGFLWNDHYRREKGGDPNHFWRVTDNRGPTPEAWISGSDEAGFVVTMTDDSDHLKVELKTIGKWIAGFVGAMICLTICAPLAVAVCCIFLGFGRQGRAMIRITINARAFYRLKQTCPSIVAGAQRTAGGDFWIWVFPKTIDLLDRARGRGESYSDVFMRF